MNFNPIESSDRARGPLVMTNKNFHEKQTTASNMEVLYFHHIIVAINLDLNSEAVSEVAEGNQLSLLCLRYQ